MQKNKENNLSSDVAERGSFLPTSHRLTPHIKAKKCTKKKINRAVVDSHAYFFFFLPTSSSSFHFFFSLISSFLLTENVGLAVGQSLRVTL
jgi:hypothetical protein